MSERIALSLSVFGSQNSQLFQVRAMTGVKMRHEEDVMLRRNGSPRSIGSNKREDSDLRSLICLNDWLIEIQEVM